MKVVKNTEREYAKALRKIARHAASIIDLYADGAVITNPTGMQAALIKYAEDLAPFANRAASKMIAATQKSIDRAIKSQSKTMAAKMREVLQSQTGRVAIDLHRAQVDLIKSLPIDAGTRAQNLAMEAVTGGRRPAEIAAEIARTGEVTQSRALLIARTESSKASAVLTEARAKSVGATHYIWRTAGDGDVRESHAEMDGEVVAYDNPPTLDGMTGNAGEFPNCFVGETVFCFDNGIKNLIRSHYTGKVVVIESAGSSFKATPNHPVLTNRGWVSAESINEFDYLVSVVDKNIVGISDNKKRNISTFDEAFCSLAFRSKSKAGFLFNFYGDVPDGDVDVVSTAFCLPFYFISNSLKIVCDFFFTCAYGVMRRFIIGGINKVGESFFSSGGYKLFSFGWRKPAHSYGIGFANSSSGYSVLNKYSFYNPSVYAINFCKSLFGNSITVLENHVRKWKIYNLIVGGRNNTRNINSDSLELLAKNAWVASDNGSGVFQFGSTIYEFSRVENVSTSNFSGHVFTLETNDGWYSVTPRSFVSKNCRCYAEPIIPD